MKTHIQTIAYTEYVLCWTNPITYFAYFTERGARDFRVRIAPGCELIPDADGRYFLHGGSEAPVDTVHINQHFSWEEWEQVKACPEAALLRYVLL